MWFADLASGTEGRRRELGGPLEGTAGQESCVLLLHTTEAQFQDFEDFVILVTRLRILCAAAQE